MTATAEQLTAIPAENLRVRCDEFAAVWAVARDQTAQQGERGDASDATPQFLRVNVLIAGRRCR